MGRGEKRKEGSRNKGLCFKEKRGSLTAGNVAEGSGPDKDTEYSPLTFWGSSAKWRSWVFREGAEGKLLLAKE